MKKTLAVLLVLLSFTLIMLCGCQETNTNENNNVEVTQKDDGGIVIKGEVGKIPAK